MPERRTVSSFPPIAKVYLPSRVSLRMTVARITVTRNTTIGNGMPRRSPPPMKRKSGRKPLMGYPLQ